MTDVKWYTLALGLAAAGVFGVVYASRSRQKGSDQRERERREWLSMTGRISDGTVYDVQESADAEGRPIQLLMYSYDVAGVAYEASQDITHLRQFVDVHSCRLGLPASVRYDTHNPGNSIVIAESWSGLRRGLPESNSVGNSSAE